MAVQDRRIRKTKAVLKSSLLSLMGQKSIKHITVKELCESADINRGTFYLHYRDVYDMLEQIEGEIFSEFTDILDSYTAFTSSKEPVLEDIFSFIKNNKDFCSVLMSDRGDISFMKKLLIYIHKIFVEVYGAKTVEAEHYFSFIIYGCIGIIENWLKTDTMETPAEMAALTEGIIRKGISDLIKNV